MELFIPEHYDPRLDIRETQDAIKYIRDTFQKEMGREMHLERISAPLFVEKSSGLNDNLNGVERPVSFDMAAIPGETMEVVHSLAKWKRMALKEYGFQPGEGLYTNMNAIRRDEELDNLHSCYVDQWDWEKVITREDRNEKTLKDTVRLIFKIIKHMQHEVWYKYPQAVNQLPDNIFFITTSELEAMYPDKTPKERENLNFSDYAKNEFKVMDESCAEGMELLRMAAAGDSGFTLEKIKAIEQKIDDITDNFRQNQIDRMREGHCNVESSILYSEMLTDYERIGDHMLNIGEAYDVIQWNNDKEAVPAAE